MKKAILFFTILFCCIYNAPAQEQIEPEEYQVYKVWLRNSFLENEAKQIILMKFTADHWHDFSYLNREKRRKLSQLRSSTLKDYRLRNRKSLELDNYFDTTPVVTLVSESLPNFLNNVPYEDFAKKSGAEFIFVFSRVGFNKKKDQALMHVHYRRISGKYATGYYFFLLKENGDWIVKQAVQSWVY